MRRTIGLLVGHFEMQLCFAITLAWLTGSVASDSPPAIPRYEQDIAPILKQHCFQCHGAEEREMALDLRTHASLLKGGETGPAVIRGEADKSLLFSKIHDGKMPPEEPKLSSAQIELIRRWIDAGAPSKDEDLDDVGSRQLDVSESYTLVNIFHTHCIVCHGKWKREAGLDLRTRDSILKGGKSGPALVPGKPDESLVYRRIRADEMPPKQNIFGDQQYVSRVRAADIDKLRAWIEAGAPAAGAANVAEVASAPEADPLVDKEQLDHWSFQPPVRPEIPAVTNTARVRNPIDTFLLSRLEEQGLSFAPDAESLNLMRRAYFDLIGLPPPVDEIERYAEDSDPQAYERLVERLLESPHYGERWAVYWLDAAGYADTHGQINRDQFRPFMWRYRDYVIRALNTDKPYDEFLTEQIAGDELHDFAALDSLSPGQLDALIATGFLRTASDATDEGSFNKTINRHAVLDEQIDIFSTAVMGLTMECARCHSHKFDPIPQRDYYRLAAIFRTAYDPYDWRIPNHVLHPPKLPVPRSYQRYLYHDSDVPTPEVKQYNAQFDRATDVLEAKIDGIKQRLRRERLEHGEITEEQLATPEIKALQEEISALQSRLLAPMRIHGLADTGGVATPVFVLRRGNINSPGQKVTPGVPIALNRGLEPYWVEKPQWSTDTSGRRLALAKWLTQPNHPLTARVMVNRVWQHHFGRGIVDTPANFGRAGARPFHPQLLDWLATEFVRRGWSIKTLHRLDDRPFGPADDLAVDDDGEVAATPTPQGYRRSIYLARRRQRMHTLMRLFDAPAMVPNCVERAESTVPTQALQLFNSKFVRECSRSLAVCVINSVGDDRPSQVRHTYLRAFARLPTEAELARGLVALEELSRRWAEHFSATAADEVSPGEASRRGLATFCHVLLNSPEFIYVD